MTEQLKGVHN